MLEDDTLTDAATVRVRQRTLIEMYGYCYRKAEEVNGRVGVARLTYQGEDESSFSSFSEDVANYLAPPERWWPTDVMACEQAIGRVLSIGCGAGRHALALAHAGHEVVGLDPSLDAVAVARRRGVDARVGGLGDLPEGLGTFDTFLLAGGGLHLLGVLDNVPAALAGLAEVANRGAWLIGTSTLADGADDSVAAPDAALDRVLYRLRVEHGAEVTEWSEWGYAAEVTPPQLDRLVAGTGWAIEEITQARSVTEGVYDLSADENDDTSAVDTLSYLARLRLAPRRPPA
ncbi:MAG: class I SAM-dependent methyltransferase [Pseudonocardiales bacterium]|nr:class I SAM-dependent methyltransferase [Pseudonocardiales bacterium]MBV9030477.1 class I SAM-dependent methyltransferase [Pseudonocardiales bacterium]